MQIFPQTLDDDTLFRETQYFQTREFQTATNTKTTTPDERHDGLDLQQLVPQQRTTTEHFCAIYELIETDWTSAATGRLSISILQIRPAIVAAHQQRRTIAQSRSRSFDEKCHKLSVACLIVQIGWLSTKSSSSASRCCCSLAVGLWQKY